MRPHSSSIRAAPSASSARRRSRTSATWSRSTRASTPPSCTHGGNNCVSSVEPARYGYASLPTLAPVSPRRVEDRQRFRGPAVVVPAGRLEMRHLDGRSQLTPDLDRLAQRFGQSVALASDVARVDTRPAAQRLADGDELIRTGVRPGWIDQAGAHPPRAGGERLGDVSTHRIHLGRESPGDRRRSTVPRRSWPVADEQRAVDRGTYRIEPVREVSERRPVPGEVRAQPGVRVELQRAQGGVRSQRARASSRSSRGPPWSHPG